MLDEGGIVQRIFEEISEIIHLIAGQAEPRLRTWSAGVCESCRERECGASRGVLRYASVEVLHHIPDLRERAVVEEGSRVLELTQGQAAELEYIVRVVGNLFPPGVLSVIGEVVLPEFGGVEMAPRRRIQRLDRVVADADVEEVLLDELPDSGDVRVIGLLVEHRSAVAREAAGPALQVCGRGEKQLRASPLTFR